MPLLLDAFSTPAAQLIVATLVHFLWQGLVLFAVFSGLLRLFDGRTAAIRCKLCLLGLMAMAACPIVTLALLAVAAGVGSPEAAASLDAEGWEAAALPKRFEPSFEGYEPYVLGFYCGGVLLLALRLLMGAAGISGLRRGSLPLPAGTLKVVTELGQRLQIRTERLVYQSAQVAEAMAVGVLRPLVLIPASWISEFPPEVLEAVIAHELAHVARGDLWVNFFQRLVETLLFYHPAVWWLSARMRWERELSTDEVAIAVTGDRLRYVRSLERVAIERQADHRPALAAFLKGERKMPMLERIHYLLGQPKRERAGLWPAAIAALVLPLGLWTLGVLGSVARGQDDQEERRTTFPRERRSEIRQRETIERRGEREGGARKGSDAKKHTTEIREEEFVTEKEGEEPQVVRRRTVLRDGKPVTEDELGVDDRRSGGDDRRLDELSVLVKRLTAQVEQLTDEVAQLRGEGNKRSSAEREFPRTVRDVKPAPAQVERKIIDARKEISGLERKPPRAAPVFEKAIWEAAEQAAKHRQDAEKERAKAERVREEVDQQKERIREEVEHVVREKVKAARENVDAEIKELERKLQRLKEGKVSGVRDDLDVELEFSPRLKNKLIEEQTLVP